MKLLWTGTDSLMLVDYSMRKLRKKPYWWIFRRIVRILDYFIEEHYCDSEFIAVHIERFGTRKPILVVPDKIQHTERYPKEPHEGFNVLYYIPTGMDQDFAKWLYGYDIFQLVKDTLKYYNVNFFVIHGDMDMRKVFPVIDFYLRPNRHDGASRLRQECEVQGIPYYWSRSTPSAVRATELILNEMLNVAKKNY